MGKGDVLALTSNRSRIRSVRRYTPSRESHFLTSPTRSEERHQTADRSDLRYVGIDLAKRSMQVCAVTKESAAIERRGLKTDETGRQKLCSFVQKEDVVAMEVCGYANTLARILTKQVGCEVHLLNPGVYDKSQALFKNIS